MEIMCILWLWIAGFLTICCYAWHALERRKSVKLGIPDGSIGWPVVGETYEYFVSHASNNPERFVSSRKKKYGNTFKTHLHGWPTICSVDPDFIKFVLQNEGVFVSRYPKAIQYLFGDGCLLNASGELHKKLKSRAVAFLQIGKLKNLFLDNVERNVLKTLSTWKDRTVILTKEAALMELNIIAQTLLNITPGEAESSGSDLMAETINLLTGGIFTIFQLNLPGTAYGRAVKARQRIHQYISELIEERQRKPCDSYDSFFSSILMENEDNESKLQLSNEQLIDFVLSIIVAGSDIPANLFTMAIKYLTECPQALKELKDEHDKIREHKQPGEALTWDDYRSMMFTQNVFNETVRLSSMVHGLYRKSLEDINYKGMIIPRNWTVLLYTRGVHLSEDFFPEPFRFNPWRWQGKSIDERHFLGFGGGQRRCPGSELGRLELAFFLHHLVTKFRWEQIEADYPTFIPMTRMVKGFPIRVKPL